MVPFRTSTFTQASHLDFAIARWLLHVFVAQMFPEPSSYAAARGDKDILRFIQTRRSSPAALPPTCKLTSCRRYKLASGSMHMCREVAGFPPRATGGSADTDSSSLQS